MSQRGLKTGDLDRDLQGQIGLESKKFCVIPYEWNCGYFTFKPELCIDQLKVLHYFKNL